MKLNKIQAYGLVGNRYFSIYKQTPTKQQLLNFAKLIISENVNKFGAEVTSATSYLPDGFFSKLKVIGQKRNFNPADALAIMMYESGVNPKAIHPTAAGSGIFGKMFGTRAEAVLFTQLSAEEQLDAYDQYMSKYTNIPKPTAANLYQLNFLPASAIPGQKNYRGTDPDTVLAAKGGIGYDGHEGSYYTENANLDRDHNGNITVGDLAVALKAVQDSHKAKWNELIDRLGIAPSTYQAPPKPESIPEIINPKGQSSSAGLIATLIVIGVGGTIAYKTLTTNKPSKQTA